MMSSVMPAEGFLVTYDVTEAQIAATREQCAALTADTPKGYEAVRVAIAHLRDTRTAIERRRVELKADVLVYGRLIDSEAKRFTALLMDIEDPLKAKKAVIDDAKARLRAEAEDTKRRAMEADIAAKRAMEEAEAKALRDAEDARLAVERARLQAEREALAEQRRQADEAARVQREAAEAAHAEERARLVEERRLDAIRRQQIEAEQQAERDRLDAERRAVSAERERADRAEFERQARIKADADAAAKAEADRVAAAERQARLDALKPDVEKVRAFAQAIRALPVPKARTKEGKTWIATAVATLESAAAGLETLAARVR